jgi:hypothetical protein
MGKNYCFICSKNYSSSKGLWTHNKKFHNTDENISKPIHKKKIIQCLHCNKQFNHYSNRTKHHKICKQNSSNIKKEDEEDEKVSISLIKKLLPQLIETFNNVADKKSQGQSQLSENNIGNDLNGDIVTNTNSNNNNNNNNNHITISLGNENLSEIISKNDQIKILNQKTDSLIEIIKLVHFGSKYPQFHNIAIDGEKAYQYNDIDNKFLETPKEDMLYDLIENRVNDICDFNEDNKLSLSKKTYSWIKSYTNMFEIETQVKRSIERIEPIIELESGKLITNKQIKL